MPPAEQYEEQVPDEEVTDLEETVVARWRFEQFRALGFDAEAALFLSVSDADLHVARRLMSHACPLELALDILL